MIILEAYKIDYCFDELVRRLKQIGYNGDGTVESVYGFIEDFNGDNQRGYDYKNLYRLRKALTVGDATEDTFYTNTTAIFDVTEKPNRTPDYVSYSHNNGHTFKSSSYWYEDGGVYRKSDHWGSGISTCDWFLNGYDEQNNRSIFNSRPFRTSCDVVGFCKFSRFAKQGFEYLTKRSSHFGPPEFLDKDAVYVDCYSF